MENKTQPSVPPVQPISQAPTSIPSHTNWLKILLFILLGIIVIAGSIFTGIQIGKNQTTNQQPMTTQPTSLPTKTAVNPTALPTTSNPIINLTEDWKTYTNAKYGYSVKYPTVWNNLISKCTGPDTSNCLDYKGFTGSLDQGFVDLSIYIEKWDSSTSIDELKKDTTTSYLNSVSFNKIAMFVSNSKEAVSQNNNGPLLYELYVDFLNPDNSLHYLISLSWPKNSKDLKLSEVEINSHLLQLNQILSTFKFTY
ncbi:MAG: hypothetical protein Q7S03_01860 [bacterium]|nr:hypothetical protein [bacterium]